jgi:hypothetical protein
MATARTTNARSLEAEIKDELASLATEDRKQPKSRGTTWWTRALKCSLGGLGGDHGCRCYSTEHEKNGEWLFDMTWILGKGGYTEQLLLVMESEWGNDSEISNDFQKLMVARARHRLMVYQASDKRDAKRIWSRRIREIDRFCDKKRGDRYLFAAWLSKSRDFVFFTYVV